MLVDYSTRVKPGDLVLLSRPAGRAARPDALPERPRGRRPPDLRVRLDGETEALPKTGGEEQLEWVNPATVEDVERADVRIAVEADINTRSLSAVDPAPVRLCIHARAKRCVAIATSSAPPPASCAGSSPSSRRAPRHRTPRCRSPSTRTSYTGRGASTRPSRWRSGNARWHPAPSREVAGGQARNPGRGRGHRPDGQRRGPNLDPVRREGELSGRRGLHRASRVEPSRGPSASATRRPASGRWSRTSSFGSAAARWSTRARARGDLLREMLAMDDGARRAGEFAFGMNDAVREFTGHTLFDEKIGGTMHLALGKSYPESGASTSRRSTGTWCAISAARARSTPTRSSSTGTGASWRAWPSRSGSVRRASL